MKPHIILAVVGTLLIAGALFFGIERTPLGSVATRDSYNSTTTDSTHIDGKKGVVACVGPCQFGSIVVTQVGTAGYVEVYDATSTASSTYSLNDSATYGRLLGKVTGATDVGGTYTFDIQARKGIVVETSTGFDGQYVITWKL